MLKVFRNKNVAKAVLWALLILILPAFVLWGTGSMGRSDKKGPTYAGTIENRRVSFDDFAQGISSMRCQVILNYFNNARALEQLLKNKPFLGKLAWDRLIMLQRAHRAGIKVSDADVVKFISTHPLFVRDGKFDDRIYEYFLKNSLGVYPRNFEEMVRENLMIQKLTDGITKDVKITDDEVILAYERDNSKFRISYVLIPASDFTSQMKVSEDEIKDFYEKHKEEFVVQAKEAEGKEGTKKIASFENIKGTINSFLLENKAKPLALESANKTYDKLNELMAKNKLSFEAAAVKLGIKTQESVPFVRSEYLEGVGDADWIAAAASKMKKDEISKPAEIRKGVLMFKVAEIQPFNQETFKKEKEDFTKKALGDKKNAYMEDWLKEREKSASLKIDLDDYDKYYK